MVSLSRQLTDQLEASFSYFSKRVVHRAQTVSRWFRDQGIKGVVRQAIRYVDYVRTHRQQDVQFDSTLGVNTKGPVGLWHLQINSGNVRHATRYEGVDPVLLRRLLSGLHKNFSSSTFIDLGCGKGRALLVAGEFKFAAVVGVEFARELADTAKTNCERAGAKVKIYRQDATEFRFPPGKLVVYFYNPFGPSVLMPVIDHLLEQHTEECYIIYVNPLHRHCIDGRRRVTELTSNREAAIWKVSRQETDEADDCVLCTSGTRERAS
jgi:SAM-dependent methyltransferase